jgi:hypothetical protein
METCVSTILDSYDIRKGYDPHEIEKITNEFREVLLNGYDSDEMSDDEIDDLIHQSKSIAKDTIASLFAAGKESLHTHTEYDCSGNDITKIQIEESLARLEEHVGDVQRTAEWFAKRKNMLTASVAENILKVDLVKKKGLSVIRDKIIPTEPIPEPSSQEHDSTSKDITLTPSPAVSIPSDPDRASVRGNRYEPVIRNAYSRSLPNTDPIDAVIEYDCVPHPKYSFLGASPDGIVVKGPMRGRMVEIKCPKPGSVDKDGNTVRQAYWCQMQLQMEVCNLPFCDYVRAVVWDTESAKDALLLLKKKRNEYRTARINDDPENTQGEEDAKILGMGTVWMNAVNGEYVYEPEGRFVRNSEIYTRKDCHPAFIRHFFILQRDWLVIRVERNQDWFNNTFLPKAREVWEEVERGREDPEGWLAKYPKRTRSGATANVVKREREYENKNAMFVDSD